MNVTNSVNMYLLPFSHFFENMKLYKEMITISLGDCNIYKNNMYNNNWTERKSGLISRLNKLYLTITGQTREKGKETSELINIYIRSHKTSKHKPIYLWLLNEKISETNELSLTTNLIDSPITAILHLSSVPLCTARWSRHR